MKSSTSRRLTRRRFLRATGATAAGALAFPYIVPSSALGADGAVAPSNRIVMAWIGTGGQGRALMNIFSRYPDVQVVAAADVDEKCLAQGVDVINERYGNDDCKGYSDFREIVSRKDIDAVTVATPDHWHALATIAALNSGKDVYCEKPLANSIGEGRAMVEAVKRNDRVLQTGSMERSNPLCRQACELVRAGRIGKLHTIHINLPDNESHMLKAKQKTTVAPEAPAPKELNFDFWLGHAPVRPYRPDTTHFWWRFILAHGGGEMTDRGAHVIDIAQMGNNTDETGPVEVKATGRQNAGSSYDTFWDYKFTNTFANGVNMIGSTAGPRGVKFEGTDGWIFSAIHGGALTASKPDILKEKVEEKFSLGRAPNNDHRRQFADAVKNRQQPFAHAEVGHRSASICHLNNLAMKLGRALKWDPAKEQVIGDDEANKLLTPVMHLPGHCRSVDQIFNISNKPHAAIATPPTRRERVSNSRNEPHIGTVWDWRR